METGSPRKARASHAGATKRSLGFRLSAIDIARAGVPSQGEHRSALALYQRSLGIAERVLGPSHPHVADTLNNIAAVHTVQAIADDNVDMCAGPAPSALPCRPKSCLALFLRWM